MSRQSIVAGNAQAIRNLSTFFFNLRNYYFYRSELIGGSRIDFFFFFLRLKKCLPNKKGGLGVEYIDLFIQMCYLSVP